MLIHVDGSLVAASKNLAGGSGPEGVRLPSGL